MHLYRLPARKCPRNECVKKKRVCAETLGGGSAHSAQSHFPISSCIFFLTSLHWVILMRVSPVKMKRLFQTNSRLHTGALFNLKSKTHWRRQGASSLRGWGLHFLGPGAPMFFPAQVTLGGSPYRCFWILDFGLSQMLEWASWDHSAPSGLWATQEYALYQINFIFPRNLNSEAPRAEKERKPPRVWVVRRGAYLSVPHQVWPLNMSLLTVGHFESSLHHILMSREELASQKSLKYDHM